MVGQERAAHSAAECSVGEDTHVQILHCLFISVEQRCRDERRTGGTGFSTRLAEYVRLEGKVSEKQPHSQIPVSVFNWGATGWMKTGSRAFLC